MDLGTPEDVLLLRHGQAEGQVADAASQRGDDSWQQHPLYRERHESLAHLTDGGIAQAHVAGLWITDNLGPFDLHYTSPYTRAVETAAHLHLKGRWYLDPRLREQDYGLEAQTTACDRQHPDLVLSARMRASSPFFARVVDGESVAEVVDRAYSLSETIRREAEGRRILIVCHEELMYAFHVALTGLPPQRYAAWVAANPIHNLHALHYTWRVDPDHPESHRRGPAPTWWRSISTADPSLGDPAWQRVQRPTFSDQELLELVATPPRIIHG
jgi:broad specificity phosphatase PhoE